MSNNSIRIRTTPLDSDKYVKLQINQNFDFLEILSLKIGQDMVYKRYCSDYGCVAGRVIVNGGVGVPNCKVSIFVEITEEDKNNSVIRELYPFETVGDRDSNNKRYNLLQEAPKQEDRCHKAVGTFPQKRRILDCDPWCEVYEKYYKYSTSTNTNGDFIIFGCPVGTHIIHMDVDLSDIGYLSQKPYDMVGNGSPLEMFEHLNEFKSSDNIDELAQIKTQNQTININPFWGDTDTCTVGINRVDFDLNYNIQPTAFFIGSIWGDSEKNSINKNCQIRRHLGYLDQMITGPGTIEMIRRTPEGGVETHSIKGDQLIDSEGVWVVQLPMNLDNVITDEFGNLVPSGSPEIGLPTKAKYRFRIGMNDYGKGLGRYRSRAHYLVPNWGDYSFDDTTAETTPYGKPNYANLEWNGVYTVKEFISRYSNTDNDNKLNFVGIKQVQESTANNPFPFNKFDKDFNPLFLYLCLIVNTIMTAVVTSINFMISALNTILDIINGVIGTFGASIGLVPCVTLTCAGNNIYCPGCLNGDGTYCNGDVSEFQDCFTAQLAESLNVFSFYFANDWIVGGLYAFLFKFKPKHNSEKFCNVDQYRQSLGFFSNEDLYIRDYNCAPGYVRIHELHRGVIKENEDILYYASNDPVYPSTWLFPTDIYNLGSMKSCDFLGKPKLVTDIPTTTFNIPEVYNQVDDQGRLVDKGIDNLLLNINCFNVSTDQDQCRNIYRYCEYGVDYDIEQNDGEIDDNDIELDPAAIRSELECLNVPSSCADCTNPPEGKFGTDWMIYRTGDLNIPGKSYFDESRRVDFLTQSSIYNSFYFYFGLLPGKSAIDKIKSQYFAKCERFEPCPIVISGSVQNNHCIGASNGSITLYPKGGTPPYKYDWYYSYPNNPTPWLNWTNDTLGGLSAGTYFVVVKDNVGSKCKKSFTVYDPSPFEVNINYSSFICPPISGQSTGYISVIPEGGNPPYSIEWLGPPYGSSILPNSGNTFYLTGLFPTSVCTHTGIGVGGTGVTSSFYNCIVRDSGDIHGCLMTSGITIDITQSCGITLTSNTVNDYCPPAAKGSFTVGVNGGGVPPYTFILENNNIGYYKKVTSNNDFYKFTSLSGSPCPGIPYTATVIDNCGSVNTLVKGISKSSLRGGFIGQSQPNGYLALETFDQCNSNNGGNNYRWYIWDFISPTQNITYNESGCVNPPFYGAWSLVDVSNPTGHFIEFGPLDYPTQVRRLVLQIGSSIITIIRRAYSSAADEIIFVGNYQSNINGSLTSLMTGNGTFQLCKTETYVTWLTAVCPNDINSCKFNIKNPGCATKVGGQFSP